MTGSVRNLSFPSLFSLSLLVSRDGLESNFKEAYCLVRKFSLHHRDN